MAEKYPMARLDIEDARPSILKFYSWNDGNTYHKPNMLHSYLFNPLFYFLSKWMVWSSFIFFFPCLPSDNPWVWPFPCTFPSTNPSLHSLWWWRIKAGWQSWSSPQSNPGTCRFRFRWPWYLRWSFWINLPSLLNQLLFRFAVPCGAIWVLPAWWLCIMYPQLPPMTMGYPKYLPMFRPPSWFIIF